MEHAQGLLEIGFALIVLGLGIPNAYYLIIRLPNVLRTPRKRQDIDKSRIKNYIAWVGALTLIAGAYNLIVTIDLASTFQATAIELFFISVGLFGIILYKKDRQHAEPR